MKKFLFTICVLFLTACTNKVEKTEITDQLQAFLIDKNIYLIGEKYDYEFYDADVNLIKQFLTSSLWQKAIWAEISIEANDGGKLRSWEGRKKPRMIQGRYYVYLDPEKLSSSELEQAKTVFHFETRDDLTSRFKGKTVLSKQFFANGVLMKLDKHDELLANYPIRRTLPIQLTVYDGKMVSSGEGVKDVAITAVALPVMVPVVAVGAVITIPYFIFGAMTGGVNR